MSDLNNDNLPAVEGETVSAIVTESDCLVDKEEEPFFSVRDMIVLDEVLGSPESDFETQIDSELVELLKYSDEEVESSANENTASEDLLILHASPPSGEMLEPMEITKSKSRLTSIIPEVEKPEIPSAMSIDPSSNKQISTIDLPSTKKENEVQESITRPKKKLSGAQRKKRKRERAAALMKAEQLKCADEALNVSNSIAPVELRSLTTENVKCNEENNLEITYGNTEEDCKVINSIKNVKQDNGKNEDLSLPVKLGKRSAIDINNDDTTSNSHKKPKKSDNFQTHCFIVTIVFTEYPVKLISHTQFKELHLLLLKRLDSIRPDTKIFPKFDGIYYQLGVCNILCLDEMSKLWLEDIVGGLRLGGELLCVRNNKIVSFFERVKAFFPGDLLTPCELLKRIKIQNAQINTTRWVILVTRQKKSGFFAFMKIPQSSFLKLEEQNNCLYFGTSRVKVISTKNVSETDTERKIQELTVKPLRRDFEKSDKFKNYKRDWVPASEQAAESGSHWKKYTSVFEARAQAPTGSQIEGRPYSQENNRSGSHERDPAKLHQRKKRSKSRWDERPTKSRWDIKPGLVSSQCAEDSVLKNDINFMYVGYPSKCNKRDEIIPPSTQVSVFTTQREDMSMEEGLQFQRVNPNFQEEIKFISENKLHDFHWNTIASQRLVKSTFEADKRFYIQEKNDRERNEGGLTDYTPLRSGNCLEPNLQLVRKLPANEEHLSSYHYHKDPNPCFKCENTSTSDLHFQDGSHHQLMIKHDQTNSQWGDRSTEQCDRYCFERKDIKVVDIRPEDGLYSSQLQHNSQNDCNRFHFKTENISVTKGDGPLQEDRLGSRWSNKSHYPEKDIAFLNNTGDKDYRPHFQDRLINVSLQKNDQDYRYFQGREMTVSQKNVDHDERSCIPGRDMYLHKEYRSDEDRPHIQQESRSRYQERDRYIPHYKDANYADEYHHIPQNSRHSLQGREMCIPQYKGDSSFNKEHPHTQQESRYSLQERDMYIPQHKEGSSFNKEHPHALQESKYSLQERDKYIPQHKEGSSFNKEHPHTQQESRYSLQERDMYIPQHKEGSSFNKEHPHTQQESRYSLQERDMYIPQHKEGSSFNKECTHTQQESRYSLQERDMYIPHHKEDSSFNEERPHTQQESRYSLQERDMYIPQHKEGSSVNKEHPHTQQESRYSLQERDMYLPQHKEGSSFNKEHPHTQQESRYSLQERDMHNPQHKEDSSFIKERPHTQQESRYSLQERDMYLPQHKEGSSFNKEHPHTQQESRYSLQERDMHNPQHKEDSSFIKEHPHTQQESRYSLQERDMYLPQHKEGSSFNKEHPHTQQESRYSLQERDMHNPQHKEDSSFIKERPHTQQESRWYRLQERDMHIPQHKEDISLKKEHHHIRQESRSRLNKRDMNIPQHEEYISSSEEIDTHHFQEDGRSRFKGRDMYISQHKEDTSSNIDHHHVHRESRFHERTASYGHSSGVNKRQFSSHLASSSDDWKGKHSSRRFNPDN